MRVGSLPGCGTVRGVAYLFLLLTAEIYACGEWPHPGLDADVIRFRVQVSEALKVFVDDSQLASMEEQKIGRAHV